MVAVAGSRTSPEGNDLVPDQWKFLFNNEEWVIHGFVVQGTYGWAVISAIAHIIVYVWRFPYIPLG